MNTVPAKRSWVKPFLIICLIGTICAGLVGYYLYQQVFGKNVADDLPKIVHIPPSCTSIQALGQLLEQQGIIQNAGSFVFTAEQMNYELKQGKYEIPKGTTNNKELVGVLRGRQMAVRLTFHNFRIKQQLAGYLSQTIAVDSLELIQLLNDPNFLTEYGYTPENVMAAFIPNTYEVYWDCDALCFWKRMLKEHKKFWTEERLQKAADLEMTPTEVYTLASIVEAESQHKPERPRIAGVYLNRLRKEGWRLEADPTVIFAVGDFSIRRVLNEHLELDSPYNTYKNDGLPPGPIYMASINAIDAVLNAEQHDYMFFCAKPPAAEGAPSTHAFAKTHRAHLRNARLYWNWIRQQR